ncbi:hypothetical protein ABIB25_005794 [Nakamurella sp. UYEF19]
MTLWDKHPDMIVHESEPYNAESNPAVLAEHYRLIAIEGVGRVGTRRPPAGIGRCSW